MIIVKVTKNQGFTLSLEDILFEKSKSTRVGMKLNPPSPLAFLGLTDFLLFEEGCQFCGGRKSSFLILWNY